MKLEDFEKYRKERYQDQIDWYDRKSQKYKEYYLVFQTIVIVLALIAPVVTALQDASVAWGKWIAVFVTSFVAIGTALLKTFRYQEIWLNYRTTAETLKKEIYFYEWRLGEYGSAKDPMQLFVDRVESLLSQENTKWLSAHSKPEKDPTAGVST